MSKDVKLLAKNFSQKAKDLGLKLTHSQSLELLAFSKGFKDWNSYSVSLKNNENNQQNELISLSNRAKHEKILKNCLNIVNAIYLDGGLSTKRINQISKIMKEDDDTVEEYFEEAPFVFAQTLY